MKEKEIILKKKEEVIRRQKSNTLKKHTIPVQEVEKEGFDRKSCLSAILVFFAIAFFIIKLVLRSF